MLKKRKGIFETQLFAAAGNASVSVKWDKVRRARSLSTLLTLLMPLGPFCSMAGLILVRRAPAAD
jgi:hypothetical protein